MRTTLHFSHRKFNMSKLSSSHVLNKDLPFRSSSHPIKEDSVLYR